MRPDPSDLRLVPLGADGKRGGAPLSLTGAVSAIAELEGFIERGVQAQLVDFDNHLDDPSKDWFNAALLSPS